jgi:uncharacterized protein (DUF1697 family)
MPRYAAFLRAVNVGGRVVKMDALRTVFGAMGFSNVETVIASGNVLFESPQRSVSRLEQTIETGLEQALGFAVTTFVRTRSELTALVQHPGVSGKAVPDRAAVYVAFIREKPGRDATRTLLALRTDTDDLEVHGHHVLWFVRGGRFSESALSGTALERALGGPATVRNSTTVRRIAEKLGGGAG